MQRKLCKPSFLLFLFQENVTSCQVAPSGILLWWLDPRLETRGYHEGCKEVFTIIGVKSWEPHPLSYMVGDGQLCETGVCLKRRKGVKETIISITPFLLQMRK